MKVEVKKEEEKEQKTIYPYLGISPNENIVLFIDFNTGTLLNENNNGIRKIGYYSNGWDESLFLPYKGSITLSNE